VDETRKSEPEPRPDGPVDQQAAALEAAEAKPPPAGTGSPGGPADEAGVVDQQDAALTAMKEAERRS
jgi:hypothetical protein